MANLIDSLTDYRLAIATARREHKLSMPRAIRSVLTAKLRYGIGPRFHSLFELSAKHESGWDDYLIDERLRVHLRRINPADTREVVNDKLAFYEHCVAHRIDTVPIRCLLGSFTPSKSSPIAFVTTEEDFANALHPEDDQLFFKLVNGTWGLDAFVATRKGSNWRFPGGTGTTSALFSFALARLAGRRAWMVQPFIKSSPEVSSITSGALSTIRLITTLNGGRSEALFANLRISVGENTTDNFGHGTSGNLVAPIDLRTGTLGQARGPKVRDWPHTVVIEHHPNTGKRIEGMVIPGWNNVLGLCARSHSTLPQLRILAWDVAITIEGPLIVEANPTFDVSGIQVANSRGIRVDLQDALGVELP